MKLVHWRAPSGTLEVRREVLEVSIDRAQGALLNATSRDTLSNYFGVLEYVPSGCLTEVGGGGGGGVPPEGQSHTPLSKR